MKGRASAWPIVLVTATVVVLCAVTMWTAIVAGRGAGFSTASALTGGIALLVVPAASCLLASVALALRPPGRPRAAAALALAGLAWLASEWDNPAAGSDVTFSLGLLLYASAPVAVLHAGLSKSGGVAPARLRRGLLIAGALLAIGVQGLLAAVVFDPAAGGCRGCARNLWLVYGDEQILTAVDTWGVRLGLLWVAAVVALLAVALVRASPAARRTAGPTLVATLCFEAVTLASYAHSWRRGFLGSDDLDHRLWAAQAVTLTLAGLAVAAELVRERRAHRALARVVVDLSGVAVSTRSLRDALAQRLDDPELVVAYPLGDGRYVDAAARPASVAAAPGREATVLEHAGRPLATLVHRAGALSGRDAADELAAGIHLGLEHELLRAQALAQVDEVRASGLRLVETGDAERRRLERDLHDGAQQRLVGLALGLRLREAQAARGPDTLDHRDGPGGPHVWPEAADELNRAIDDLRTLARGLSPVLLADAGLAAALRGLAESRDLRLVSLPEGRFAPVVESTAYAVVDRLCALGPVDVDLRRAGDRLVLRVTSARRASLDDLHDRVTTLGGYIETTGRTTTVTLPL